MLCPTLLEKRRNNLSKWIMTASLQVLVRRTITTARLSQRMRTCKFLHRFPHKATARTIGTSSLVLIGTPAHALFSETSSETTQHHTPTNLMHLWPLSHLWMVHVCIFMRCHSTSPRRDATNVYPTGTQHLDKRSGPGLLEHITD